MMRYPGVEVTVFDDVIYNDMIFKMRVPIARSTQLQRERAGTQRERGRSTFHLGTMSSFMFRIFLESKLE